MTAFIIYFLLFWYIFGIGIVFDRIITSDDYRKKQNVLIAFTVSFFWLPIFLYELILLATKTDREIHAQKSEIRTLDFEIAKRMLIKAKGALKIRQIKSGKYELVFPPHLDKSSEFYTHDEILKMFPTQTL